MASWVPSSPGSIPGDLGRVGVDEEFKIVLFSWGQEIMTCKRTGRTPDLTW